MQKPKTIDKKILYEGYLNLNCDTIEKNDGEQTTYTYYSLPNPAVVILGISKERKFLLTKEYRHPINGYILSCSGGKLETGEDPLIGGKRELLEETGYTSDDITLMGACHPIPALSDQKVYFLLAKNVYLVSKQKLDPFEFIEPVWKTQAEIQEEIAKASAIDGHLLTALSFYQLT